MNTKSLGKTGNAPIVKQGQTAGQYGNDPNFNGKGLGKSRDLNPR